MTPFASPFATLADIEARHPADLITLAADEATGVRDDERANRAVDDATAEIMGILRGRYGADEIARIEPAGLATLKVYAIDIALYRIALSFARSSERIEKRYDAAIKRLTAIAGGQGGLPIAPGGTNGTTGEIAPNDAIVDANERAFSRDSLRGM